MKRTRSKSFALIALVGLVLPVSGGCAAADVPGEGYVTADRATYNAIAPVFKAYVEADPKLEAWQKESKLDTLKSWNARTTEGEKAIAAQKNGGVAPTSTPAGGK